MKIQTILKESKSSPEFAPWMPQTREDIEAEVKSRFGGLGGTSVHVNKNLTCSAFKNMKLTETQGLKQIPEGLVIPVKFQASQGSFIIAGHVISLEGSPDKVGNEFHVESRKLINLIGGPKTVKSIYKVWAPNLTSIAGICQSANRIDLESCESLKSLSGIHKYLKEVNIIYLPQTISGSILGLLLVKCKFIMLNGNGAFGDLRDAINIIRKWKDSPGPDKILACQEELISTGLKEYAKF